MSRNDSAIKGSLVGLLSQIINLISKFVVRTYVIRLLGQEILGLDSVLLDTINMLSLAEMGITSVMLFRLYNPVLKGDKELIDEWMASYRQIYRIIAFIVAIIGIIISFLLPFIIKGITVSWTIIYFAYYLYLINSVSSYLLAYKRILLDANQERHISLLIDLFATLVFSIAKIMALNIYASYLIYLLLTIVQTIFSNILVHRYAKTRYPFVSNKTHANKTHIRLVYKDANQVLANKLSGYAYNSTDNLVISIFLGTGIVGLLSNYKYIANALKGLMNSTMSAMQPLIGNYLNSNVTKENSFRTLKRYSFVRFVIAGVTTIPFFSLANTFVLIWTKDSSYLMGYFVVFCLTCDYYIGCLSGALGEYIVGMGMFKDSKYISFYGACTKILLSLIGIIVGGLKGVLIATVISQIVIWGGDFFVIFFKYYSDNKNYGVDYFRMQFHHILLITFCCTICFYLIDLISIKNLIVKFILGGIFSEFVFFFFLVFFYRHSLEYIYLKDLIINKIFRNKKR